MATPLRLADAEGLRTYTELLGLHSTNPLRVAEQVQAGLRYGTFERFRRYAGMPGAELAALVRIPERTLARRRSAGRLDPDESDRLVRLARVFALALALFEGHLEGARRWLATPLEVLGGEAPLHAATTDPGAREVEALVGRLEHGIPA
jgi:putative toxin-antitoxin system antitoxin component (TIGR02293 family)